MKCVLLLLVVLLTPHATHAVLACALVCNGGCDAGYLVCSKITSSPVKCLSAQTTCKSYCAKICSCDLKCELDCLKPQGACKSTLPAKGDFLCKAQQILCQKVQCTVKCLLDNLPKSSSGLPSLPDLKIGASILPLNSPDLLKIPSNPLLSPLVSPSSSFPANPIANLLLALNINPTTNGAKPDKSTAAGNVFSNPTSKVTKPSPDSGDVASPPKSITKPDNSMGNPLASNSQNTGTINRNPPKKQPNTFFLGKRQYG